MDAAQQQQQQQHQHHHQASALVLPVLHLRDHMRNDDERRVRSLSNMSARTQTSSSASSPVGMYDGDALFEDYEMEESLFEDMYVVPVLAVSPHSAPIAPHTPTTGDKSAEARVPTAYFL